MGSRAIRAFRLGAAILTLWCLSCIQPRAEETNTPALAAAMKDIPATVEQGLASAAKGGRPISAKFEMDGDEAALSVYLERSDGFREVLINPRSGNAAGATMITEGDDLKDAQAQSVAMANAKTTLLASAQHAVGANPEARVVSVIPELQNGHPVAIVTLLRGDNFTKVTEQLD
jgi:hypothetical protein